jgi:hypothetical protein
MIAGVNVEKIFNYKEKSCKLRMQDVGFLM